MFTSIALSPASPNFCNPCYLITQPYFEAARLFKYAWKGTTDDNQSFNWADRCIYLIVASIYCLLFVNILLMLALRILFKPITTHTADIDETIKKRFGLSYVDPTGLQRNGVTEADLKIVSETLQKVTKLPYPDDYVLGHFKNPLFPIRYQALFRWVDNSLLDETIFNYFFWMLEQAHPEICSPYTNNFQHRPSIPATITDVAYLHRVMNGDPVSAEPPFQKQDKFYPIFDKKKIFIPLRSPNHWSMVEINIQNKKIYFYDSIGRSFPNSWPLLDMLNYAAEKRKVPFNKKEWTIETVPTPFQRGSTCGVHAATVAMRRAQGHSVKDFSEEDIPYIRIKIFAQILHQLTQYHLEANIDDHVENLREPYINSLEAALAENCEDYYTSKYHADMCYNWPK